MTGWHDPTSIAQGIRPILRVDANIFTIALAAQMLGETEDRLWALADQMDPQDSLVWIHDTDERQTLAFTSFGLETDRRSTHDRKLRSRGLRRMFTVERFFSKLKRYRAVATRYEKHAANFRAAVKLAAQGSGCTLWGADLVFA